MCPTWFLTVMTPGWLTSNERMAFRAPTYRVEPSPLSNRVVVFWEAVKWASGLSVESEQQYEENVKH